MQNSELSFSISAQTLTGLQLQSGQQRSIKNACCLEDEREGGTYRECDGLGKGVGGRWRGERVKSLSLEEGNSSSGM